MSGLAGSSVVVGLSTEHKRNLNPFQLTVWLRRTPDWARLCRHTAFSSQPTNSASTFAFDVFLTVKRITVAGRLESSAFSGMNGENASSDTETGDAASLYSTNASGYSPQ